MRRLALLLAVACLSCALPFGSLMSQEPAPQSDALYVFLDCQTFHCDFDHFRREISYVNWSGIGRMRRCTFWAPPKQRAVAAESTR
jgi:hypothetical protein